MAEKKRGPGRPRVRSTFQMAVKLDQDVYEWVKGLDGTENLTDLANEALRNQFVSPDEVSAEVVTNLLKAVRTLREVADALEGLAQGKVRKRKRGG